MAKKEQPKITRIVAVKPECPFRAKTARAAWYALAAECVGEPVDTFVERAKANPPSYHVRGKNAGQPEDPVEWLLWLASDKVAAITLATE